MKMYGTMDRRTGMCVHGPYAKVGTARGQTTSANKWWSRYYKGEGESEPYFTAETDCSDWKEID